MVREDKLVPISFSSKPGLVAYLTAGDPSLEATYDIALAAIDNGAQVIELGVPFSDPLADGPVIQRASEASSRARCSVEAMCSRCRNASAKHGPTAASSCSAISIPSCAWELPGVLCGSEGQRRGRRPADRHDCRRGGRVPLPRCRGMILPRCF